MGLNLDEQAEARERVNFLKTSLRLHGESITNTVDSKYTTEEVLCALHELQTNIIEDLVLEQKNRKD